VFGQQGVERLEFVRQIGLRAFAGLEFVASCDQAADWMSQPASTSVLILMLYMRGFDACGRHSVQ